MRVACTALAGALLALTARAGIKEGGPDKLADTKTIADVLRESRKRSVHIIFVHGMRATQPGSSEKFRNALCQYVDGGCRLTDTIPPGAAPKIRFYLGTFPDKASIHGQKIWNNEKEWLASRPFVDRYVYSRPAGQQIIVDEVNWWPLLFPLKCRSLLVPDADLSGPDKTDLKFCSLSNDPYYPWINESDLGVILDRRPKSGGGAWLNTALKQQIMNWGLADAVIAVGPMRVYIRRAMNAAFDYARKGGGQSQDDQEFVVISESLGSFAVLDAFESEGQASRAAAANAESMAVREVLSRAYYLYFFANQFAMLDLARVDGLDVNSKLLDFAPDSPSQSISPFSALQDWARQKPDEFTATGKVRQVVAFSDPSDILTFYVPAIEGAKVVNLYDRNGFNWFGLFENPVTAHTGHSGNKQVLKKLFGKRP